MSFALIGVVAMQLYFLWQSYNMQSKLFDRSINEALNNVATKASKHDAIQFLNNKVSGSYTPDKLGHIKIIEHTPKHSDSDRNSKKSISYNKRTAYRARKIAMLRDSLKRMILQKQIDEQFGSAKLQIHIEEYTDEFGVVHGRLKPEIVKEDNHVI